MQLLRQLCEMHGIPGREEDVRDFILEQVKEHVDDYQIDAMGNLICRQTSEDSSEWMMVACHMDEIGFYVRYIDPKGFLWLQPVGGFDPRNLFSRRVVVKTKTGQRIGTMNPCTPPIHVAKPEDRKKVPEVKQFYIDLGLPAEQVHKEVRIGDPVSLWQQFEDIGNYVSCKAMDNRIACWVGINLLKAKKKLAKNLAVVFTVQEEVGVRGAMTSAFTVNPDISVAIDVTLACDTPHTDAEDHISVLGGGACIKVMDSLSISCYKLVDRFVELAQENEIKYQMEVLPRGGTDAAGLQKAGTGSRAITLSVPTRYIHTITETIDPNDLRATLALLTKFCENPTNSTK